MKYSFNGLIKRLDTQLRKESVNLKIGPKK